MFEGKTFVVELTDAELKQQIQSKIEQNGGKIVAPRGSQEVIIISDQKKRDGKTVDPNYITTCLNNNEFMDPSLYQHLVKLSTKMAHTWTPQELASVLVYYGFSFERAKLFYDAEYSGAELRNILQNPTPYYSDTIPKVVWTSFTHWILQTFFRYWSKEQTETMLKQRKEYKGMGLSDTEYKNQYSELIGKEIGIIVDSEIVEECYFALKDWIHNTMNEEIIIPLLSFKLLTNTSCIPEYSHSIPYQNNRLCVRNMGNALLNNLTAPEARFKYLVCNFAYFGFGKTRLGVEFQKLFNSALSDNTYLTYLKEEYSEEQIESLQKAKMVYINFIEYSAYTDFSNIIISNIVARFNIPPPPDSMNIKEWISTIGPIYIVLDEFQLFVSKQANDQAQVQNYYEVWNNQIRSLQEHNNVFLYICGKGLLFELIGKGYFRAVQTTSPTLVHSVQLESLNLNGIVQVLAWLKVNNEFIPELSKYLLKKTGGIPIFVHFAVMSFNINLPTLEETIRRVNSNLSLVPIQLIKPISSTTASNGLANIYRVIVWASILKKTFTKTEMTDVAFLSNIPEFKEIQKIDILQLSLYCNNYIEEIIVDGISGYRIILPEIIIDNYLTENDLDVSFIYNVAKRYPHLVDNGDVLEYLIALRLFLLLSLNNGKTIGAVIPFLCNTPLEKEIINIPQSSLVLESFGKFTNNSSKVRTDQNIEGKSSETLNTWPDVIKYMESNPLQLFKFKTASSSPDSIMYIPINSIKYYLCFQEKNESDSVDFTTVKNEVCKTIPLLESSPGAIVVLVILVRSGCALKPRVYTDETIEAKKHKSLSLDNSEMRIPKQFYLVIPSIAEFEQFVGKMNAKALNNLPKLKKQSISLADALELVIPGAEVYESSSKKKKSSTKQNK